MLPTRLTLCVLRGLKASPEGLNRTHRHVSAHGEAEATLRSAQEAVPCPAPPLPRTRVEHRDVVEAAEAVPPAQQEHCTTH